MGNAVPEEAERSLLAKKKRLPPRLSTLNLLDQHTSELLKTEYLARSLQN